MKKTTKRFKTLPSGCKIPIGSAYQRPLRREFTPEEYFWQNQLIGRPENKSELIGAIIGGLLFAAFFLVLAWL